MSYSAGSITGEMILGVGGWKGNLVSTLRDTKTLGESIKKDIKDAGKEATTAVATLGDAIRKEVGETSAAATAPVNRLGASLKHNSDIGTITSASYGRLGATISSQIIRPSVSASGTLTRMSQSAAAAGNNARRSGASFRQGFDDLRLLLSGIDTSLDQINRGLRETDRLGDKLGNKGAGGAGRGASFLGLISGLGAGYLGYRAAGIAKDFVADSIRLAAANEQTAISFEVMLGSAEKARTLQAEIFAFAAATPFQAEELAAATKQLVAYGIAGEDAIPTLRRLGEISAALSIPLGDLAYLYGTTRVQGRLFAQDMNQFVGRGIPLIGELAKQFGVAESEVKGLVESGQVGFENVRRAIVAMTDEGGKFAGLMARQSESAAGRYSTLKDAVDSVKRSFGAGLVGPESRNEIKEMTADIEKMEASAQRLGTSATALISRSAPAINAFMDGLVTRLDLISGKLTSDRIAAGTPLDASAGIRGIQADRELAETVDRLLETQGTIRKAFEDIYALNLSYGDEINSGVANEMVRSLNEIYERKFSGELIEIFKKLRADREAGKELDPAMFARARELAVQLNAEIDKQRAVLSGVNSELTESADLWYNYRGRVAEARDVAIEASRAVRESIGSIDAIGNSVAELIDNAKITDAIVEDLMPEIDAAVATGVAERITNAIFGTGKLSDKDLSDVRKAVAEDQRVAKERERLALDTEEAISRARAASLRATGRYEDADLLDFEMRWKRRLAVVEDATEREALLKQKAAETEERTARGRESARSITEQAEILRIRRVQGDYEADIAEIKLDIQNRINAAKSEEERIALRLLETERLAAREKQAEERGEITGNPIDGKKTGPLSRLDRQREAARGRQQKALDRLNAREGLVGSLSEDEQARRSRLQESLGVSGAAGGAGSVAAANAAALDAAGPTFNVNVPKIDLGELSTLMAEKVLAGYRLIVQQAKAASAAVEFAQRVAEGLT